MDEVIPGLWVGDITSAKDTAGLKSNNIFSILSAMRGRVTINEVSPLRLSPNPSFGTTIASQTFIRHQILLDDTDDTDVLVHFIPAITFIQSELDKGRGVLVHCHAGMSRSVTIVAAYLMYTQNIDVERALDTIRAARPNIDPNPGFLLQLEIFHKAAFKISRRDKTTRMFYMERAVEEVMNGDGSLPETTMFAKYPRTPTDSAPSTPGGPRRRIRCKMCRQELATREHMLDHGQLGAPTPASGTPVASRAPSMSSATRPRLGSTGAFTSARPRRPSGLGELSMSALEIEEEEDGEGGDVVSRRPPIRRPIIHGDLSMSMMSALDTEDDDQDQHPIPSTQAFQAATLLGRRLSDAVLASPAADPSSPPENPSPTTHFSSAEDMVAQLNAHPKLAALRNPAMTPLTPLQTPGTGSSTTPSRPLPISAPILVNPKCSGYFVEPMKWMEPFLEDGQIAGKIMCPNKKCSAKLGNYDWAGMCCGCKEWVTPGFCINRSKVDEVV